MDYKELSQKAHENAVGHGFWEKDWSNEHCLMLIIGEVSEMVEAHRKGLRANVEDFKEIPNLGRYVLLVHPKIHCSA